MEYDAVLAHAQLAHLEAAALRLPLDSARYYLLALLPARADAAALPRLLARLARRSDLRDVYAALRPTRVRARIPSFTVKGHVILTSDLQKVTLFYGVTEHSQSSASSDISVSVLVYVRRYLPTF